MSVWALSQCGEEEFDKHICDMPVKGLMETITYFQKEMAAEQENFNSLSLQLHGIKDRNSHQYKQISKDMMKSQGRLTMLMNRSMKCFAKQNTQHEKQGVDIHRQDSLKSIQSSTIPKSAVLIHRSKSMYIPQYTNDPYSPPQATATTANSRLLANTRVNTSFKVVSNGLPVNLPASHTTSSRSNGVLSIDNIFKNDTQTINHDELSNLPSVKMLLGAFQKSTDITNSGDSNLLNKVAKRTNTRKENENRNPFPLMSNDVVDSGTKKKSVTCTEVVVPEQNKKVSSTLDVNPSVGKQWNTSMSSRPRADSLDTRSSSSSSSTYNKSVSSFSNVKIISKAASVSSLTDMSDSRLPSNTDSDYSSIPSNTDVGSSSNKTYSFTNSGGTRSVISTIIMLNAAYSESNKGAKVGASHLKTWYKNEKSDKITAPDSGLGNKDTLLKEILSKRKPDDEESSERKQNCDMQNYEGSGSSENGVNAQSGSTGDSDSQTNGTTEISTVTFVVKGERPEKPRRMSQPKSVQDTQDEVSKQTEQTSAPSETYVSTASPEAKQQTSMEDDDETVKNMNLKSWNPCKVLKELFPIKLMEDTTKDISDQFICMEGFMEKLPMNKKKATLLKTWKRRFFKAADGWLYYYETSDRNKPSETIQLMGGNIQDLGNRILGIDDGRGRFLMVRCPTDREHGQWKLALNTQTADNTKAQYIHPVLKSSPHPKKKVVVIDLGSNAIRAGLLGQKPSLPELFFPSVVAVHNSTGEMVVGMDAYFPGTRHESKLLHPIRASNKIDKFAIDEEQMPAVFRKVFQDLHIKPEEYLVMLSTPMDLSDNLRKGLMTILVDGLQVAGVCMVQQALLSLYSYNTTSGIIVDVGETIEILPIYDGFVIEGGVSMLPYGAEKIEDSLQISLMSENYRFSSRIERLLVKYIMEKSCFVAADYKTAIEQCKTNNDKMSHTIQFESFDLPIGAYVSVTHDISRFKSPEGLFDMNMWEMDFPNLHKLIFQAIQSCPMDSRRHMYRSVYLSGGVTMLPGFRERLQSELVKLAPPNVPVEVHAAPQRYHAAFIGGCSVAGMDVFEQMCILREVWQTDGVKSFNKWKAPKA